MEENLKFVWDKNKARLNLRKHYVSFGRDKMSKQKGKVMRKITPKEPIDDYELLPEYKLDYSKSKPNRFASRHANRKIILLDPDVAKVFPNGKVVNDTLRAIANIIPKHSTQRKKSA